MPKVKTQHADDDDGWLLEVIKAKPQIKRINSLFAKGFLYGLFENFGIPPLRTH
jgi:hypothetical protein